MSSEFIEDPDNIFNPDYEILTKKKGFIRNIYGATYGQRFPTRHVLTAAATGKATSSQAILPTSKPLAQGMIAQTALIDPYTQMEKMRFEDAFRADPTVRAAIIRKAQFMLGKRIITTLDVASDLTTIQELAALHDQNNRQKQMDDLVLQKQKADQQVNQQNMQVRLQQQKQNLWMLDPNNQPTPQLENILKPKQASEQQEQQLSGLEGLTEDQLSTLSDSEKARIKQAFAHNVKGFTPDYSSSIRGTGLAGQNTAAPAPVPNIYDPKVQAEMLNFPVDEPADIENLPMEKLQNMALEYVMSNQEYQQLKNQIDLVNKKVDFHAKSMAAVIQSYVGGRSALFVEKGKDDLPVDLKVLNWARLGLVTVDPTTWQLSTVQYTDFEEPENILAAEDILYFPSLDFHITANTLWYGLSHIEPIAHVSESNRIIDEMDLKEMNRSLWAGIGIIKTPNKDVVNADRMLSAFQPGLWTITDIDTQVEMHALAHDLDQLIAERSENDRRILRGLEVPSPLVGFEEITNRATIEQVLLAWKESVLESQRTWFRGIIERQWFDTMTAIILQEPDIDALKVKVKCEFEDITIETLAEKAGALIPLYEAGIIPVEKILKMLDMDDVIEQMRVMQQQYQKIQAQYIKLQQEQAQMSDAQQKYNPDMTPQLPGAPGTIPPGPDGQPSPTTGPPQPKKLAPNQVPQRGMVGSPALTATYPVNQPGAVHTKHVPGPFGRTAGKTDINKRKYSGIPSLREIIDGETTTTTADDDQQPFQEAIKETAADEQAESQGQYEIAKVQLEYAKKKLELISNLNEKLKDQS